MTLRNLYVMGRSARGRPTLQHRLHDHQTVNVRCGTDTSGWSKAYQRDPIEIMLCRRCNP